MKLNKTVLIVSILAGIVACFIAFTLYIGMVDLCSRPLLIALMVAVLALIVCAALFAVMHFTDQSDGSIFFLENKGALAIALVVLLVVLFLLGMLLEWIYDHDVAVTNAPTSYIFLLDESGSMGSNDPNQERHNAVNTLMETVDEDFPYAVYMFADSTLCVREMAPVSDGEFQAPENISMTIGATTMLKEGLNAIVKDIEDGKMDGGDSPLVIVLTDGAASDMVASSSGSILKKCKNAGVSISSVGLGIVDERLLEHMAAKTGGSYVHIDNAQDLAKGFTTVAVKDTSRDLFSTRYLVDGEFLYGFLRVLFLTVLGALIALMKAVACAKEDDTMLILIEGAIASLVASILVEGLTALGAPLLITLIVYCVLVAATPVHKPVQRGDYGNIQLYG